MFHIMKTADDFEAALEASHQKPIVIFKHSASCPFSGAAQIEAAHAKHDLDIYGIVVQYTPELKEAIAERLGVEHKSPQAIVVHEGKATADFWRSAIKERQLKLVVKELLATK
ncbi:MAG: monothiol bacilliredoxin BrxC family protein [Bacteroidota bacterium]